MDFNFDPEIEVILFQVFSMKGEKTPKKVCSCFLLSDCFPLSFFV